MTPICLMFLKASGRRAYLSRPPLQGRQNQDLGGRHQQVEAEHGEDRHELCAPEVGSAIARENWYAFDEYRTAKTRIQRAAAP